AQEREAGVGTGFYPKTLNYHKLHAQGHVVDNSFLQDFFFNTIFQYYTFVLLDFDPIYNYTMWQDPFMEYFTQEDLTKFQKLAKKFGKKQPTSQKDINDIFPLVTSIKKALQ